MAATWSLPCARLSETSARNRCAAVSRVCPLQTGCRRSCATAKDRLAGWAHVQALQRRTSGWASKHPAHSQHHGNAVRPSVVDSAVERALPDEAEANYYHQTKRSAVAA